VVGGGETELEYFEVGHTEGDAKAVFVSLVHEHGFCIVLYATSLLQTPLRLKEIERLLFENGDTSETFLHSSTCKRVDTAYYYRKRDAHAAVESTEPS
jgi:hypothetical protein